MVLALLTMPFISEYFYFSVRQSFNSVQYSSISNNVYLKRISNSHVPLIFLKFSPKIINPILLHAFLNQFVERRDHSN